MVVDPSPKLLRTWPCSQSTPSRPICRPWAVCYRGIAAIGLARRIVPRHLLIGLQVIKEVFGFFGWWFIW
ncbi:hypothetical protein RHMOL_Rhmol08G0279200 [Rhododendron molle]|uniref:Uncharacterized protein n=1 Tax=Rhododendron molle TaxID=49168 RepID=A0ACC0MVC5_RHOML|nr:hypothetical protein RHMOL_Rhmol08G0279200 [Rhododendron molle]